MSDFNEYLRNQQRAVYEDPASPQYQAIAEAQRQRGLQKQAHQENVAALESQMKQFEEQKNDYYQALKDKHGDYANMGWNFRDKDYLFIDAIQPMIDTSEDPQYMKERIAAASMYSNLFKVPIETAFLNLENYHEQWTGQNFSKKTGLQAVGDSLKLNFVSAEYNRLSKELSKTESKDPALLQAVQEKEREIERLRDHAPKVWQSDYVKMGGWDDVGQIVRSLSTTIAENAMPIATGIGAAAIASTGIGAIAEVVGLSAGVSGLLVAGASRAAIAGSTYNSTWGIKYREMTNQGIPHDIALQYSKADAFIEGVIEGALGGVEAAGASVIKTSILPQAANTAMNRWFVSGKMGRSALGLLNVLKEGAEEGSEELSQGISSGHQFNKAADAANAAREEKLKKLAAEPIDEIRKSIEKELENYPEIDKKKWGGILRDAFEGAAAGFLVGAILGVPIEIAGARADVRAASALAALAREAPSEAAYQEAVKAAEKNGFQMPLAEGMKTDEKADLLSDIYKVQQERMSPEQREAKQRQAQDAEALAGVTDYSNVETEEYKDEETGETVTRLAAPDADIYRENNRLETEEFTDTNEDGSVSGQFVAYDPRTNEEYEGSNKSRYGYINYTETEDAITIDNFKMYSGHEKLRPELYRQFAERFAGRNIVWNPKNEQHIALRDELINDNKRGPKFGLNYYENPNRLEVSDEARQFANRMRPLMRKDTKPIEVAASGEIFRAFWQRKEESLTSAMNRIEFTNKAPRDVIAAQLDGQNIKGAHWIDEMTDTARSFIYLSKTAADLSTLIHEHLHEIARKWLTQTELNIAARALGERTLKKDGKKVIFQENVPWTPEHHEAFAEAGEAYFINGTAPNEEIKTIFEKIKEFMKRLYHTMKGWTELSPQADKFFQSLFSGELVDQAKAEEQKAQTKTAESETEAIINDPNASLEEKAQAVFDAAGEVLLQAEYNGVQEGLRDRGSEVMRQAAAAMSSVLETGKSTSIAHEKYGDITVDAGEAERDSFGLKHIIKQRYEEGKSVKEITALLILLDNTLKNGEKKRDIAFNRQPNHRGRMELDARGIVAIVSKQRKQGDSEQWVLTGFVDEENKEATDTIQKGISRYGYAPEFLGLEKQVGAVVSSLQISSKIDDKSSLKNNDFPTLFQIDDREMMEDAAECEDGKAFRELCGWLYEMPQEAKGLTEEQTAAWFDEFVRKAKQAVKSSAEDTEQPQTTGEKAAPAELDREFNELIGHDKNLEKFVETVAAMHNDDGRYGQTGDEETAEEIRRKLTHPTWQLVFMAKGEMGPTQRKQLLTLIRHNPRTYRAIYAQVMEREDLEVSPEDAIAPILKHRIKDTRRENIDGLTPEQERQLLEEIDLEDFEKLVRTGRAQFNDPIEKKYIKSLQDKIKANEEALKELEAERQDDNNYITRQLGDKFKKSYEQVLKAREYINGKQEKLDKAIKSGEGDIARLAMQKNRANANYTSIVQNLKRLAGQHDIELTVNKLLAEESINDYVKSAKAESRLNAALIREAARAEIQANLDKQKAKQEMRAVNIAKRGIVKRILRRENLQRVNAEQAAAAVNIQRIAEQSLWKGIERFLDDTENPYLRSTFEQLKVDSKQLESLLKGKHSATQEKIKRLLNKNYEELAKDELRYFLNVTQVNSWANWEMARELEDIRKEREDNFPIEADIEMARKYLPDDVYYRIVDKPFSEWTLAEAEELAKIIDDLTVQGREIYKANIEAEQQRIRRYQQGIIDTIGTVSKAGLSDDEKDKERNKYNEGDAGTAQSEARSRKLHRIPKYTDLNMYRMARILDNGRTDGKNMAALYRRESEAFDNEHIATDKRKEKVLGLMKELGITLDTLWSNSVDIDLGGDLGKTTYTAAELMGFLSATRDDYSRAAVAYGNLLSERERGEYQEKGITALETTPLQLIANDRFEKVKQAAEKFIAEHPDYKKLMEAIDKDFAVNGQRLNETLLQYNNHFMKTVDNYFPMIRKAAVSSRTEDADLAHDLMGASSGGFQLFVEKGFTKARQEIPIQYQTAIKLDLFAVWDESVNKEEHFIAYGKLVKDLNAIYKSRRVKDTICRRYGKDAVDYINKYINELANPNPEKIRSSLDNWVRFMRGNTAAAYLGWKTSSIALQAITSPAPFFAYMNPLEYWGTYLDFMAHQKELWAEIEELSPHMKHRSANLLTDIIKEQAKQKFDSKAANAISKFNEKGVQGLEWIDRVSVAPGWLVLYRKETNRLTNDKASGNMSEGEIKVQAARYADEIVRATQPSGRASDLSPLFKANSEIAKAFLQFTQSLNVVWQNVRYDMPQMIRDGKGQQAARMVIGYAVASIMLGAVMEGFDEDDDEAMKARKVARWMTMQFTDAFPIIGSEVSRAAELAITGKAQYSSGANLFPVVQKGAQSFSNFAKAINEKDPSKAFKGFINLSKAAGLATGLPVSASEQYLRAIGIGDGDGELKINPGALVGRR